MLPANHGSQVLFARGYTAGKTVSVENTLAFTATPSAVSCSIQIPVGWTLAADTATTAASRPTAGQGGPLAWQWTSPPASPLRFTYTLNVPPGESVSRAISAEMSVGGSSGLVVPAVLPLHLFPALHTADTDGDGRIGLVELTRVIELYNVRLNTTRTGAYTVAPDADSEDGFAPDFTRAAASTLRFYHAADSNRDGRILAELTRVIELYNTRTGTSRTGQYRVREGTEDGFEAAR